MALSKICYNHRILVLWIRLYKFKYRLIIFTQINKKKKTNNISFIHLFESEKKKKKN